MPVHVCFWEMAFCYQQNNEPRRITRIVDTMFIVKGRVWEDKQGC